jgi:exopolyphosphatase/pppGpp-phosphohydrolase
MTTAHKILLEQQEILHAVVGLAQTCDFESTHTNQVTRLALRLFDELLILHQLSQKERFWLQCAAILHDIGWIEGWKSHHKTSLRIILGTPLLPFHSKERLIIGSIARYHRKALPDLSHDNYAALELEERKTVSVLSACLRLADGLDRSHKSRVEDLICLITPRKIIIQCAVQSIPPEEAQAALEKVDLMAIALKHKVKVEWKAAG